MSFLRLLPFLLLGFTTIVAQTLLAREMLSVFLGNELIIGMLLADWLALTALGSYLGGKVADQTTRPALLFAAACIIMALSLPAAIYVIRTATLILPVTQGEALGLAPVFWISLLVTALPALAAGTLFPLSISLASAQTDHAADRVYILEAVGAVAGGLTITFFLIPYLHSLRIAGLVGAVMSGNAALICLAAARRSRIGFIAAIVCMLGLLVLPVDRLHENSINRMWRPYTVTAYEQSWYGTMAVVAHDDQYTFAANHVPLITTPIPDVAALEELAHFPLLAHPDPKKILVVGGGAGGLLAEILKHPVTSIDYVETDPLLVPMLERFSTPLTAEELGDRRVSVYLGDGRFFVRRSSAHHDLLFLNAPSPVSLQLNRYFTLEFFRLARHRLNPGGLMVLTLPGSETYPGPALIGLQQSVYQALRTVFPKVRVVPGIQTLLIAAVDPAFILDPERLRQALHARSIPTLMVNDFQINYRLAQVKDRPLLQNGAPPNRDNAPLALWYAAGNGIALLSPSLIDLFQGLDRYCRLPLVLLLCAVGLMVFMAPALLARSRRVPALPLIMTTTGAAGMVLELGIFVMFQSWCGYLYNQFALLLACFMGGMGLGGFLCRRWLRSGWLPGRIILKAEAGFIVLTFLSMGLARSDIGTLALADIWLRSLLYGMMLAAGLLTGIEFPAAVRVWTAQAGTTVKNAGTLYGIDLAGACAGAFAVGVLLIPRLGLVQTLIVVLCLKGTAFMVWVFQSRKIPTA
jgi:spermidine synthase